MTQSIDLIYSWRLSFILFAIFSLYACGYQLRNTTPMPIIDNQKIMLQADDPILYQAVWEALSQAGLNIVDSPEYSDTKIDTTEKSNRSTNLLPQTTNTDSLLRLSNTEFNQEVRLYDSNNQPKIWRLSLSTQLIQNHSNKNNNQRSSTDTVTRTLNEWIDIDINSSANIVNNQVIADSKQLLIQRIAQQVLNEFR